MVPYCINFDRRQAKSCFPEHNTYRGQAGYNSISLEVDSKSNPSCVIFENTITCFSWKLDETWLNFHYKIKYILKDRWAVPVKVIKLTTGWHRDYIRLCWQAHVFVSKNSHC